jgi:hypothetical protein
MVQEADKKVHENGSFSKTEKGGLGEDGEHFEQIAQSGSRNRQQLKKACAENSKSGAYEGDRSGASGAKR